MARKQKRSPAHVAKCDDDAPSPKEEKLPSDALGDKPYQDMSPAEWAYERLVLYIQNFEEQLDDEHEVAMGFAGGDVGILRIEGLGYFDPDLITFYGTDDDGIKTQLIQHVSQLNVLLRAEPREETTEPPNRIGFRLAADLGKHASGEMGEREG